MRFRVAVCEGKAGRAVMVGGRQISPFQILQPVEEVTVINGVRMFIQKNKNFGWLFDIGRSLELPVLRIKNIRAIERVIARVSDHGVH